MSRELVHQTIFDTFLICAQIEYNLPLVPSIPYHDILSLSPPPKNYALTLNIAWKYNSYTYIIVLQSPTDA